MPVKAEDVVGGGARRKRDKLRSALSRLCLLPARHEQAASKPVHTHQLSRTPTNHQDLSSDPLARLCVVRDPRAGMVKAPLVKVGQGRAGAVFATTLGTLEVAVKEIKVPTHQKQKTRLVHEVSALQALSRTPGIIRLHEAYLFQQGADRKLWLVMERAGDGPLTDVITKVRLTEAQMSVVLRQLLEAVRECHRLGWLHRDIKSDNVLVMADGSCRLADFGAATWTCDPPFDPPCDPPTNTQPHQHAGTPHWTAPEAITHNRWSTSSDVWSVGCVLVEMVRGEPPLWSLSQEQVLAGEGVEYNQKFVNSGSEQLRHLSAQLLDVDPGTRITVNQALCHPFVTTYAHLSPDTLLSAVQKCHRLQLSRW